MLPLNISRPSLRSEQMESYLRNEEGCLQFLDFMERDRDSAVERVEGITSSPSLEQKLELRLGPPGGDWSVKNFNRTSEEIDHEFVYSNGFFSKSSCPQISPALKHPCPAKTKALSFHLESENSEPEHLQLLSTRKESSQLCDGKVNPEIQNPEKKFIQPPSSNTAVPNCSSSQKRTSPASVVGWPPIRSFPKKHGNGSSSKTATTQGRSPLFVKINMDGVPIGRKIDINAYDNYEKLSMAIDELFRDLLPAQSNTSDAEAEGDSPESREHTLVYEDNEGDRMLVGDLPWHMFVSTVKRLRVLKTTDLHELQHS